MIEIEKKVTDFFVFCRSCLASAKSDIWIFADNVTT